MSCVFLYYLIILNIKKMIIRSITALTVLLNLNKL